MNPLAALARPEHTGANRCWPCTAINLVAVLLAAALVSGLFPFAGPLVLAGGLALVYLRGYVVPYTPEFGPKVAAYLPWEFGHATDDGVDSNSLADGADAEDLLAALFDAGVLVEAADGDIALEETFRADWTDRMAEVRTLSDPALADRVGDAAPPGVTASAHGDRILLDGDRDNWLSRAVAIAEVAAIETLAERDVPESVRVPAAEPLRTLLGTCPVCGGDVRETTLRNCCGGPGSTQRKPGRLVLACADCDTVVHEFRETAAERAAEADAE
ncbi:hypothetical protein [Haloparvum alkalitolerans]|uniref:hypothetical protein n=1 Tax=Haloparvum alkalitolerans TaxID=1042953 RepID=UPI003CF992D4